MPELRRAGFDIDFVFSGRAAEDFFNMQVFGENYRVFQGLTLVCEAGQLKPLKTALNNNFLRFIRDAMSLQLDEYDLIISDFEPVTAWAAKMKKRRSLGISHQCAFDFDIPKAAGHFLSKRIMQCFAPTTQGIGLHWHHFNHAILPPMIEPQGHSPVQQNKILIYMGFEDTQTIIDFVTGFSAFEFIIYAKVQEPQYLNNITVKPFCHEGFHRDLESCNGVISNAGFELASECLQLGKKLLIKPLQQQYEQESNALALQLLNRATVMQQLHKETLAAWLSSPSPEAVDYPNVAEGIALWLKSQLQATQKNPDSEAVLFIPEQLAKQLWQRCQQLPHYP